MPSLTTLLSLPRQYPVVRGMVLYAVVWPTSSITQEYIEHGTTIANADWGRAARFGVFGCFFMAPVFYGWLRLSGRFFTRNDLATCVKRVFVEQITYSPIANAYFFFGMSALEAKPIKVCVKEVKEKFLPTYKTGLVFWPAVQTINFYLLPERHRILFVSLASFAWTIFLSHAKAHGSKNVTRQNDIRTESN